MFALQIYEQKEYKQLNIRKKKYIQAKRAFRDSGMPFWLGYTFYFFFVTRPFFGVVAAFSLCSFIISRQV